MTKLNPVHFIPTYFFRIILIISSILHLGPAGIFCLSDFATEILLVFFSLYMCNMPRPTDTSSLNTMIIIRMVQTTSKVWGRMGMIYEDPVCFWFVSLRYLLSNTEVSPLIQDAKFYTNSDLQTGIQFTYFSLLHTISTGKKVASIRLPSMPLWVSRDNSIDILTNVRRPERFRVRIPVGVRDFFSYTSTTTLESQSASNGTEGPFHAGTSFRVLTLKTHLTLILLTWTI